MRVAKWADLPTPSLSARIITVVVAIAWLFIGVSEVISPKGWDASYGVPLTGEGGLPYVRAVGARNIVISLLVVFFVFSGMRAALAAVFVGIALVAAMDFYTVSTAVGAGHAVKHAVFVLVMASIALWVVRSRGRGGKEAAAA